MKYTDIDFLEKRGYLEGLKPKNAKIVKNLVMQVNEDMIKGNELAEDIFIPIIRHIVNHITEPSDKHEFRSINRYLTNDYLQNSGVTEEKLLTAINIGEFMNNLVIYCQEYLPLAEKYLPYLDGQAELTVLFSHNYMAKILYQVISQNEKETTH
jgi:hypothetical protein